MTTTSRIGELAKRARSSLVRASLAASLVLGLSACLESEERITVHEDGSLSVELQAKGKVDDLADGYPLPLHAPWQARNDTTLDWIARVGPDTGSARTRANAAALPKSNDPLAPDGDKTLLVGAEFARAEDLPHGWAPAAEPFADAYQQRSARLSIERKGEKRVYVFERTLAAREFARYDTWTRMQRGLDDAIVELLEHDRARELDDAQRTLVVDSAVKELRGAALALGTDALASIYVEGDADLRASDHAACVSALGDALAVVVTRERIQDLLTGVMQRVHPDQGDDESAAKFNALERELRDALRRALGEGLARAGVPLRTRNAALGQLEWLFTSSDQTTDLADEGLIVRVRMPGNVVGGNFTRLEADEGVWEIPCRELRDRAHVLRIVSVVE